MNLVQDAISASNPSTAKQFLGSVQPRPIGQMVMYVAILSLMGLIGTIVGYSVMGLGLFVPMTWAIILGVGQMVGTVVGVVAAGFVLAMLSTSLVGRQISNEEGVTLVGLGLSPALLAGILLAIPFVGWILSILALLFSAFLIFQAAETRFGAGKGLPVIVVILLVFWIVGAIVNSVVMGIYIGSVMSSYGYGAYAKYY